MDHIYNAADLQGELFSNSSDNDSSFLLNQLDLISQSFGDRSTPDSNTGVVAPKTSKIPFRVSSGWTTLVFFCPLSKSIQEQMCFLESVWYEYTFDKFRWDSRGYDGYAMGRKSDRGVTFSFTPGRTDFEFKIPQSVCDQFDNAQYLLAMKALEDCGGRMSRYDWAVDDFDCLTDPAVVKDCYYSGDLVSRLDWHRYNFDFSRKSGELFEHTFKLGRRASMFHLRVYDKFVESKGLTDGIRWECELKSTLARGAFKRVFAAAFPDFKDHLNPGEFDVEGFNKTVLAIFLCKIDFKHVNSNNRSDRRKRIGWWDVFLGAVAKAKFPVQRYRARITDTIEWMVNSVAPTFFMLFEYFGDKFDEFLERLWMNGQCRQRQRHKWMLAQSVF